jgi:hypothetical protein
MTASNVTKTNKIPIMIKILATAFLFVVIPVYWVNLGPDNFLWGSDIALFITTLALWLESRFIVSMMAVGVLLTEILWNIDLFMRLFFGSHLFGLDATSYIFNTELPSEVRVISLLFHIYLPIMLIWMLIRLGYHSKAWLAQIALCWIILPLTYLLTDPADNINWVFGPGREIQQWMPGPFFVLMLMILFPIAIYMPTHLILNKLFGNGNKKV